MRGCSFRQFGGFSSDNGFCVALRHDKLERSCFKNQEKPVHLRKLLRNFAEKGVEMRIFGLKNCDTCRKAVKLLDGYRFFDVRVDLIPDEILDAALQEFGDDLVNKKSTTWRNLSSDERAMPPRDLLRFHPAVMKRPLIETHEQKLYLSWSAKTQAALL